MLIPMSVGLVSNTAGLADDLVSNQWVLFFSMKFLGTFPQVGSYISVCLPGWMCYKNVCIVLGIIPLYRKAGHGASILWPTFFRIWFLKNLMWKALFYDVVWAKFPSDGVTLSLDEWLSTSWKASWTSFMVSAVYSHTTRNKAIQYC